MDEFQTYLNELADYEQQKSTEYLADPRHKILVNAGIHLNWLGDYLANPAITWSKQTLPVNQIEFTGTNPEWNEILINQAERSPAKLRSMVQQDPSLRNKLILDPNGRTEPIIVRRDKEKAGYYKILDRMPLFVQQVLDGATEVEVLLPNNEDHLPICEPHVLYDLMRGFERHANDELGQEQLYQAITLLVRTYANIPELLTERFGNDRVFNVNVRKVLDRVRAEL